LTTTFVVLVAVAIALVVAWKLPPLLHWYTVDDS